MKQLKFIHITKNGGTSIEYCAMKHNEKFGKFHNEYSAPQLESNAKHHTFFPSIHNNIKEKYDWFMVVRNPYDRILSEYHCKWGGKDRYGFQNNAQNQCKDIMNKYIQTAILNRHFRGNHYSEQYKYLDTSDNINIHILKFENLKAEFDDLMLQYKMNIELNVCRNQSKKRFSVSDFSKKTIDLINSIYEPDFRLFGYDMI